MSSTTEMRELTPEEEIAKAEYIADINAARTPATDLSLLFEAGILDREAFCPKCSGSGSFVSYSGRPVGECFTCSGTGLSPSKIAKTAEPSKPRGDCEKCSGSGEWRRGLVCFACNGTGNKITGAAITVDAIITAFASARAKGIKSPKLRLADFVFSRAPDSGKNAGAIYVKSTAGEDRYLGKVQDGKFLASWHCDDPTKAEIIKAASDPHNAAKAYGMRTGSCSCCGRELTNAESIDLGIGPICRDKFGWG